MIRKGINSPFHNYYLGHKYITTHFRKKKNYIEIMIKFQELKKNKKLLQICDIMLFTPFF